MTIKVKYMRGQNQRFDVRGWLRDRLEGLTLIIYEMCFWGLCLYFTYHYLVQLFAWIVWKYYPK